MDAVLEELSSPLESFDADLKPANMTGSKPILGKFTCRNPHPPQTV